MTRTGRQCDDRSPRFVPQSSSARRVRPRKALMLVVVLVMVVLLSLLAASYAFMVRANMGAVMSNHHRFQARMAAESGFQRAVAILRDNRNDPGLWYHNPDLFRGVLVEGTESESDAAVLDRDNVRQYDPRAEPAWRFSLMAPNYEDPTTVRYGLTDECSKLDLNRADENQLRLLMETVIPQDIENAIDINVLVDSLLDWRAASAGPRPNGAKDEYYQSLDPPYRCKQGPFVTVEELLLVRGFTAWVMFGEDYNRNGMLDPNEDDADASFPPDNADGLLYRGIAPFFTLWSQELNVSNDQRPRINLNMRDTQKLQELLSEDMPSNIVNYVMQVRASGIAFNSVMNLIPAPPPPPQEEPPPEESPPPTSQPQFQDPATSQSTSQPTDGMDAGSGNVSSDLKQLSGASENKPPPLPVFKDLTDTPPPGTYEDLPLILDRLTVQPVPAFVGRINVNTAPLEVLGALSELTDEEVLAIVDARRELAPEERSTPAWLLTRGVLDEYQFRRILDKLATKSSVFTIECVGYADHVGVVERINTVFEMRGPIPQVIYQRNLGSLGMAYTPHGLESRGLREGSN